jgi:hypothetical protein
MLLQMMISGGGGGADLSHPLDTAVRYSGKYQNTDNKHNSAGNNDDIVFLTKGGWGSEGWENNLNLNYFVLLTDMLKSHLSNHSEMNITLWKANYVKECFIGVSRGKMGEIWWGWNITLATDLEVIHGGR